MHPRDCQCIAAACLALLGISDIYNITADQYKQEQNVFKGNIVIIGL